ncbi:MAG TPA: 6-phosphogluconolactonase [Verrucomicrobia bacterium]|nr:6-phosphogluconolactonase [Verrucomicrobiota bacterium]HOB31657.1 6-phosphogluconolactonase [Verrucomicrobiota bacterium]HOP97514.1 6-phosphogluconolactonase [Verrucomicrobiota bacterium]HPU55229.1 6-phosphogluconolactonase [Verrucomicrobiota bacterium]
MKRFELIPFASASELADTVATEWLNHVTAALSARPFYAVALSGGRISRSLFAAIAEKALARKVSLDGVHFFWADERCVPPDDPESNFRLAYDLMLRPLNVREAHIHRIRGEEGPVAAAAAAEAELRRVVDASGRPILDLVFLGLGEDGHIASLFPGRSQPEEEGACYVPVFDAPKPPPSRVSLTASALSRAREVWMLASGAGKEAALDRSLIGATTPFGALVARRSLTRIFTDIPVRAG